MGATLSEDNHHQLYVPAGFAHGFCVVSDTASVVYKASAPYAPDSEHAILSTDAALAIPWPVDTPELSKRDRAALPLAEVPEAHLPRYEH